MPIRNATKDEIEAMMQRLREKQEQRRLEADIAEVIGMVKREKRESRPPLPAPAPEAAVGGGQRAGHTAAALLWFGVHLLRRMGAEEWLFLLALTVIGLVAINLAK